MFKLLIFVCAVVFCEATPTPGSCGKNEIFVACQSSNCLSHCGYVAAPGQCPVKQEECRAGCECMPGHVARNGFGPRECIPVEHCGKCFNEGEEHRECGSRCNELTCDNYRYKGEILCSGDCVNGCFCKAGLVRHPVTRMCIRPRQCRRSHGHSHSHSHEGSNSHSKEDSNSHSKEDSHDRSNKRYAY